MANIESKDNGLVYGIVATGTHDELARLYDHAETILGGNYLPRAVLVQKTTGEYVPALTYISNTLVDSQANDDYVERIAKPAEQYNFPKWYIEELRAYKNK